LKYIQEALLQRAHYEIIQDEEEDKQIEEVQEMESYA